MDPILEEELLRNVEMASARGHVQRAKAAARNRGPPGGGDSGLANHLLVKWAYGTKSAELVKTEAALAYKAGARGGYLKQLSEIGSKQGGNVARDLMELVREILGVAIVPILVVLVPLFVSKGEGGLPQPELCPSGLHMSTYMVVVYVHTPSPRVPPTLLRCQYTDQSHGENQQVLEQRAPS